MDRERYAGPLIAPFPHLLDAIVSTALLHDSLAEINAGCLILDCLEREAASLGGSPRQALRAMRSLERRSQHRLKRLRRERASFIATRRAIRSISTSVRRRFGLDEPPPVVTAALPVPRPPFPPDAVARALPGDRWRTFPPAVAGSREDGREPLDAGSLPLRPVDGRVRSIDDEARRA